MTFLNPFVLLGLAAASLPVLFHLFAQRRAREVEFTSLRFLKKLEKSSMRTVRVRQILLLIIRTLLVIAVVMAFARPAVQGYLGGLWGSSHASSSLVILIDNSASMSRSDEHGTLLKQAKDAAKNLGQLVEEGDDAVILPLATLDRSSVTSASAILHGRKAVVEAIEKIDLTDRPAQLNDGLHLASAILAQSKNINKEVYLISDDQARNLFGVGVSTDSTKRSDTSALLKLFDPSTKIFHIPIGSGDLKSLNLAIDSLLPTTTIFEPGRPVEFNAWVRNTSDVDATNPVLSLFYNDERVAQQTIPHIAAHATERVAIAGASRGAGIVSVRAELEQDQLPFDNRRFAVINIPATRHIAIYTDDPSSTTFLKLALEQSLSSSAGAPFSTELHPTQELRSIATLSERLDGVMVMISRPLDQIDLTALHDYVYSGRGVAIFLQPGIDVSQFNSTVSPKLGLPSIQSKNGNAQDAAHYVSFAQLDLSHPFFAGMFDQKQSKATGTIHGIESPKFYEFYTLNAPRSSSLIQFSNGAPLLISIPSGKGEILLYSVPPTLQFSDMPRKGIFLPLMRRTAAYVSAIRAHRDENAHTQYVTTEPFDLVLPELRGVQAGTTVVVKLPGEAGSNGKPTTALTVRAPITIDADGRARIHLESASVAGNYSVYLDAEARDPIGAFAVNAESAESDLTRATTAETRDALSSLMTEKKNLVLIEPTQTDIVQRVIKSRFGVELWQAFLAAALILALIEMLMAREAKRT
jgi:hypothetical protein